MRVGPDMPKRQRAALRNLLTGPGRRRHHGWDTSVQGPLVRIEVVGRVRFFAVSPRGRIIDRTASYERTA